MKKILYILIMLIIAEVYFITIHILARPVIYLEVKKPMTLADMPEEKKVLLDVPVISQLPELPRGCEVTSLTMLLNYAGVEVTKMELAEKIRKVPYLENGLYGHPNSGFVGNIYTMSQPGLGVYDKPIQELANKYIPYKIVNLTGEDFRWVLQYLDRGRPVWVINNTTFNVLAEDQFATWQTVKGKIKVTTKEHSVVITGYDNKNIYLNDPLTGEKNKAVDRESFIAAWEQMGKHAITYSR
ncbi:peptidase C39 family protein [Oxobacter pfennigii]|uniref:Peptidase C39 family protein n=1 Tax=Oxobacter pfennigii TaxID=36849 RepID=A0A0P8WBL4_9CLOT|nr:C39 family peptidase [Oxobacter pfennigii]KPU45110.1 peptidase C39 family protein [Oxobacter pfennigii]